MPEGTADNPLSIAHVRADALRQEADYLQNLTWVLNDAPFDTLMKVVARIRSDADNALGGANPGPGRAELYSHWKSPHDSGVRFVTFRGRDEQGRTTVILQSDDNHRGIEVLEEDVVRDWTPLYAL